MKAFILHLQDARRYERIDGVVSFVGEDRSGSFGILANHGRMLTSLVFGLARFRSSDGVWHYVALPGGLLYFADNRLSISTRHFLRDDDYERLALALKSEIGAEEESLRSMKEQLRRLQEAMLERLYQMRRRERR